MNVVEAIQKKVFHLPPDAQEEVLKQVEQIEAQYHISKTASRSNGDHEHPLSKIAKIQIDGLPADFAARHDFYCHGKLEE